MNVMCPLIDYELVPPRATLCPLLTLVLFFSLAACGFLVISYDFFFLGIFFWAASILHLCFIIRSHRPFKPTRARNMKRSMLAPQVQSSFSNSNKRPRNQTELDRLSAKPFFAHIYISSTFPIDFAARTPKASKWPR